MNDFKDYKEEWKESTEKLWEATRNTFKSATHRAGQYKDIVQKKIDMASIHKKITAAHTDLGKFIDDARTADKKNILKDEMVNAIFQRIDDLKQEAARLEEEIQMLRETEPVQEPSTDEPTPTNSADEEPQDQQK
ncbi:MAG: hypothetical protein P1P74_01250 [Desulfuromonadales bacterium]|nr:hypothetical protein [Desulfuromonadales bacterium]MDT8422902.1 hypothetical protein [Desulfuromonadales bacterium]